MRLLFSFMMFAVISLSSAYGETVNHNGILLSDFWIRATPPGHGVSAGYLDIKNSNDEADRLISVSSDFAGRGEIHEMRMDGDIMKMRQMEDGLMVAGAEMVSLAPGGNHLMFMNLNRQIVAGEMYQITLIFEQAGEIDLAVQGRKSAPARNHKH